MNPKLLLMIVALAAIARFAPAWACEAGCQGKKLDEYRAGQDNEIKASFNLVNQDFNTSVKSLKPIMVYVYDHSLRTNNLARRIEKAIFRHEKGGGINTEVQTALKDFVCIMINKGDSGWPPQFLTPGNGGAALILATCDGNLLASWDKSRQPKEQEVLAVIAQVAATNAKVAEKLKAKPPPEWKPAAKIAVAEEKDPDKKVSPLDKLLAGTDGKVTPQPQPQSGGQPAPAVEVTYLGDLPVQDVSVWNNAFGVKGALGMANVRISQFGKASPNGIGMHPPPNGAAKATFVLDRKYATLLTGPGLNDTQGGCEPFICEVWGDGRKLYEGEPITFRRSQEISVDVQGVDKLQLVVRCEKGNNSCHAVWIEPRLLKATPKKEAALPDEKPSVPQPPRSSKDPGDE